MTVADGFAARVHAEAREVHVGKMIAVAFAAVFFAIGWILAKIVVAVAWIIAAVRVGWIEAGGPRLKSSDRNRGGG